MSLYKWYEQIGIVKDYIEIKPGKESGLQNVADFRKW